MRQQRVMGTKVNWRGNDLSKGTNVSIAFNIVKISLLLRLSPWVTSFQPLGSNYIH